MDRRDYNFYSLFHHDISYVNLLTDFNANDLVTLVNDTPKAEIKDIADSLYSIIRNNITGLKDSEISLTLTGGLDSRLILACLLRAGVKPNCMTYGNSQSTDVYFAKKLAGAFNLEYHNACNIEPTKEWYCKWVIETIKRDKGHSHLHRAHRTAAIAEHVELYNPKVLFTGHMGGEGLRGLTYNNYFSSPFFELVNEKKMRPLDALTLILKSYFINIEGQDLKQLTTEVMDLPWMKNDVTTNKLYYLYDLVAQIHHYQDIRLYKSYIPKVIPVFLQKAYLITLFSSKYSFLSRDKEFFKKLYNPYIYCKLLDYLFPELLKYPLANGFTPEEYLKGIWYYIPVKVYRKKLFKNSYPSSFSYGKWFEEFVKEHAHNIDPWIWDHYNRDVYFKSLKENKHLTDEGYWHKFSNPVFFDLVNKYRTGKI